MNDPAQIKGNERLVSVFGSWPTFHDSEVLWLRLDRALKSSALDPALEVMLHMFERSPEVDSSGAFVLRNHVLVHLRFSGVADLKIEDFNQQNVLFAVGVENIGNSSSDVIRFHVHFEPAWGLGAEFRCHGIEVVSVKACDTGGCPL